MMRGEGRLGPVVGAVLMGGGVVSILLMALGLALLLLGFPATPSGPSPESLLRGALALSPSALMELGIVILTATPAAGVAVLGLGFSWQRQFRFALVSLAVLVTLLLSLVLSTTAI